MSIDQTAGRLIEFGERYCGAQAEAARFLLLGDADGGEIGLFRGAGVGGVLLEKDFATRSVAFGIKPTLPAPPRKVERLIQSR